MAPTTPAEATGPDVVAAGAVVVRKGVHGREVLLVHRPKYDDWSFPKGKREPGEHVTATAVREVLEETGVEVRLGRPLLPQLYAVSGGRAKIVHYWVGKVLGDDDVSTYPVNDEVDEVAWCPLDEAPARLTYLDDLALLDQFREHLPHTTPLVVVRHAKAVKRGAWDGEDPLRPLTEVGEDQARALAPMLHAYGVSRVLTSTSVRCSQTVAPYAAEQVLTLEELPELSEEQHDEPATKVLVAALLASRRPTVLCSHRPVLPGLLALLGVDEEPLSPAELIVCHHRHGSVVATERHHPR